MAHRNQHVIVVRMDRLASRRAVERLRETYHQLSQAADRVEPDKPIQEAEHEPVSGSLCQSVNPATRTGSDD